MSWGIVFFPVMCEHFSQKERWVINKPKHALENATFKNKGGESSFMGCLLMSLYISWQMKTNACEKASCSRAAFHKLITCNSILVHLGAWLVPDAHIMRGHINERSFTSSSKQEKHRWPATPPLRRPAVFFGCSGTLTSTITPRMPWPSLRLSLLTSGFH